MTSSHDDKLVAVMRAVLKLPIEPRNVVLRHIASRLPIYGTGCPDSDFDKAMRVVLRELILRMISATTGPTPGVPPLEASLLDHLGGAGKQRRLRLTWICGRFRGPPPGYRACP
jgi:hypothetical protein